MNVISRLPAWAQDRVRSFAERGDITGSRQKPMDQDSFEDSFKLAGGVLQLAGADELAGEDQALGQPGLVRRNGLTLYFEGDSSSSSHGEVEAVTLGRYRGVEYVNYVHTGPTSFSTLRLTNDGGSVDFEGSVARREGGAIDGYLITG